MNELDAGVRRVTAHNFVDLTGLRYGLLTVVRFSHTNKAATYWLCQCDCGALKPVHATALKSGDTKSCGCLRTKRLVAQNSRHGERNTRLYRIWTGMKSRCGNKNQRRFSDYGGRGITVCSEWADDFVAFATWARANGYADHLTIDRADNDSGYSPDNCRWITRAAQNANRRKAKPRKVAQ